MVAVGCAGFLRDRFIGIGRVTPSVVGVGRRFLLKGTELYERVRIIRC